MRDIFHLRFAAYGSSYKNGLKMVRRYKNGVERLQEYGKRGRKRPYTIKVTDKGCRGINLDFHKLFRITQLEMRGLISFMI